MKKYLIFTIILLAGCVSAPVRYNPDNVNEMDLANITTFKATKYFNSGYNAWIEFVWNDSDEEITKRNSYFDNALDEIKLPAGKYKIQVICKDGTREAHPEMLLEIETAKHYVLSCDVRKGSNIFGMAVDSYAKIKVKEVH